MKRMMLSLMLLIPIVNSIKAQTDMELTSVRQKRFNKIDFQHIGIGTEIGVKENWFVGFNLFYGIGSYRNLLNTDVGIGYQLINFYGNSSRERIMLQQLPVFASLHLNIIRRTKGCVYIGAGAAYYFAVKGEHHIPLSNIPEKENCLGKSHAKVAGSFGVRLSHWDFSLRYTYDLSPSMNQKFVFESTGYDYDYLHASIFERSRFAFSVSYLLPLKY